MALSNILLALCLVFTFFNLSTIAIDVSYDGRALKIDGERKVILSGSIHYPRSTPEMWPSLIQKAKDGGLNTIETYVFWNSHEPERRQYDFSENLDLVRFIKTIQKEGLYSLLRIGPYVCAEWNFGTKNDVFMNEMANFTTLIVNMMKHENLFASQGGPIILAQIENEYGNIMSSYGDDGKQYMNWCAKLAQSYHVGVPWIMCQQSDAPQPMINACNGFYCDQFYPNNKNSPKFWTENWTGWFKSWGQQDPHRTAEDVAFAVARFFQNGGTLQNYYMYHGGTNFGRTSGGPYITTSYDYDAPLDEYGNLNQPKWGHLKQLHLLLISNEKILTYGSSRKVDYGNMVTATIYNYAGKSVCFLGNAHSTNDATINFENTNYSVPAWSVTILQDCYKEVYNTAKVNVQTSIMVKKDNEADDEEEPYKLEWEWRGEQFEHMKNGLVKGSLMSSNKLIGQKLITNDTSDYLWYITSFNMTKNDSIWGKEIKLHVHTTGHIIHAFVNGKHVGSQYALNGHYSFDFEKKIKLKLGENQLALLSATVGLSNYGANFDQIETGIHGPVQLTGRAGNEVVTRDLSSNKWFYKIGLHGEQLQLYNTHHKWKWYIHQLPTNRLFVWYKTTFKAPLGTDPVVVDLMGLGKGMAWVNGNSLGRYWPGYLANENGCSPTCDFRGSYGSSKCRTNCGKPSQRWYHVPRSFLNGDKNILVLFEEFGGNPGNVKFQTVTVGKACANTYEGNTLELSCQGGKEISDIKFASFGGPKGTCGSFKKGDCESPIALSVINKECLGKESCSINVNELTLGPTSCRGIENRLAVEAICSN
ncbi:Beta-galactosidase [Quillaja saponaria]|uniref:Beta-galactosidase n=1 Tax=Quillaja saponaria TaxID=32244 RepID=A0AAD7VHK2_QUISA|nr:Beta-galactosidase [Quillaja saponaria]